MFFFHAPYWEFGNIFAQAVNSQKLLRGKCFKNYDHNLLWYLKYFRGGSTDNCGETWDQNVNLHVFQQQQQLMKVTEGRSQCNFLLSLIFNFCQKVLVSGYSVKSLFETDFNLHCLLLRSHQLSSPPSTCSNTLPNTSQDTISLPCCKGTLFN